MSAKSIIKNRKGYSVLLVILGIIVAGIAMLPITKWYLSLHAGMEDLDTRFEMQSIVQDAWNRLLAEDYDETNERIKTNGNTFTEDIGSKWTLQYTYGSEGKYSAAQCTSTTPGDDDQKCRKVTISLTAKDGSVKPYSIDTTRVSSASGRGKGGALVDFSKTATKSIMNNRGWYGASGYDYKMEEDGYCYLLNTSWDESDYRCNSDGCWGSYSYEYFRHTINGIAVPTTGYVWLTKGDIISGELRNYNDGTGYSAWRTLGAYSSQWAGPAQYHHSTNVTCYKPR